MKLQKAIELNTEVITSLKFERHHDYADAVSLGNESLKAILKLREGTPGLNLSKLPGEDNS